MIKVTALFKKFKVNSLGFSIVEVLLIVMIVGFIASLINLLPPALGLVGSSKHEVVAKQVAQKQIEDLRSSGYDNLANTSSPPPSIVDSRLQTIPGGSGTYTIQDCEPPICQNSEQIKNISIVIAWIESGNKPKNIQVNTLIAKGGLQ